MRNRSLLLLACGALLLTLTGCSSTPTLPPPPTSAAGATEDLIRVGDSIAVRLSGVPAQDQGIYEVKVDESGNITMPYIGNIPAANSTTVALQNRIENAYRSAGVYPSCNVQIFTREVRYVNVTGEVRAPQRVPYTKDLTVTSAIAACGGYTEYANKRRVRILRGGKTYETNTLEILKNPTLDVPLAPSDIVQVERSIF